MEGGVAPVPDLAVPAGLVCRHDARLPADLRREVAGYLRRRGGDLLRHAPGDEGPQLIPVVRPHDEGASDDQQLAVNAAVRTRLDLPPVRRSGGVKLGGPLERRRPVPDGGDGSEDAKHPEISRVARAVVHSEEGRRRTRGPPNELLGAVTRGPLRLGAEIFQNPVTQRSRRRAAFAELAHAPTLQQCHFNIFICRVIRANRRRVRWRAVVRQQRLGNARILVVLVQHHAMDKLPRPDQQRVPGTGQLPDSGTARPVRLTPLPQVVPLSRRNASGLPPALDDRSDRVSLVELLLGTTVRIRRQASPDQRVPPRPEAKHHRLLARSGTTVRQRWMRFNKHVVTVGRKDSRHRVSCPAKRGHEIIHRVLLGYVARNSAQHFEVGNQFFKRALYQCHAELKLPCSLADIPSLQERFPNVLFPRRNLAALAKPTSFLSSARLDAHAVQALPDGLPSDAFELPHLIEGQVLVKVTAKPDRTVLRRDCHVRPPSAGDRLPRFDGQGRRFVRLLARAEGWAESIATNAMAALRRMSRSVTGTVSLRQLATNGPVSPLPAARRSARVRAVIAWLRANRAAGCVETIRAPLPSAAACWLQLGGGDDPLVDHQRHLGVGNAVGHGGPPLAEARKASDSGSDYDPRFRQA